MSESCSAACPVVQNEETMFGSLKTWKRHVMIAKWKIGTIVSTSHALSQNGVFQL